MKKSKSKLKLIVRISYGESLGTLTRSFLAPDICDKGSADIAVLLSRDGSAVVVILVFSSPGPISMNNSLSFLCCSIIAFVNGRIYFNVVIRNKNFKLTRLKKLNLL